MNATNAKSRGPKAPIPFAQAERILQKFGGARRLAELFEQLGIGRDPATIYKWTYEKAKGGTDGLIPTRAWPDILQAAAWEGVVITPQDMDPRAKPAYERKPSQDQKRKSRERK